MEKLNRIFQRLSETIVLTPIETGVSVLYLLMCIGDYEKLIDISYFGWTFPICFFVIYAINRFTRGEKYRWGYYVSAVIVPVFWFWDLKVESGAYWVSLILSQLLVLLCFRAWKNREFVSQGVNYFRDTVAGLCLALVGWLLSMAVYYSFIYIFDLTFRDEHFIYYSFCLAFILVAPILFLMFNICRQAEFETNRFFALLVNFILSPALLVYIVILYLYAGKIVIEWSLPKGGITYMVTCFMALMLLVKSVQPFLERRYYNWFYNAYSWWTLPALIMLWVGILYRISEYGFTELRVYLVLMAAIATIIVGVFFGRRDNSYSGLAGVAFVMLALFTYVPFINASDLGIYSQQRRLEKIAGELGSMNSQGHLVKADGMLRDDEEAIRQYQQLYASFKYVKKEKGMEFMLKEYGIASDVSLLDSIVPKEIEGKFDTYMYQRRDIYLYDYSNKDLIDVRGFDTLVGENLLNIILEDGILNIEQQQGQDTTIRIDLNKWLAENLTELGIKPDERINQELLDANLSRFMSIKQGNVFLKLSNIEIEPKTREIKKVSINFMLKK